MNSKLIIYMLTFTQDSNKIFILFIVSLTRIGGERISNEKVYLWYVFNHAVCTLFIFYQVKS